MYQMDEECSESRGQYSAEFRLFMDVGTLHDAPDLGWRSERNRMRGWKTDSQQGRGRFGSANNIPSRRKNENEINTVNAQSMSLVTCCKQLEPVMVWSPHVSTILVPIVCFREICSAVLTGILLVFAFLPGSLHSCSALEYRPPALGTSERKVDNWGA